MKQEPQQGENQKKMRPDRALGQTKPNPNTRITREPHQNLLQVQDRPKDQGRPDGKHERRPYAHGLREPCPPQQIHQTYHSKTQQQISHLSNQHM
jgi:hypothetical protein